MPKGRAVEPWMKHQVARIYLDLKQNSKSEPTSTKVREGLRWEIIQRDRDPEKILPSKRFIQEVLRTLRSLEGDESVDKPNLDSLWSLGASSKYAISPEASPFLLDIQRWCSSVGHVFTVREATWAEHLRMVIPQDISIERKHHWTWLYAVREKTSDALGVPMDTRDLDAFFTMRRHQDGENGTGVTPWIYDTAVKVGEIPELFEDVRDDGDSSGKRYRYGWGNPAVATLLNLDLVVHEAKGDKPWIIRQIEVLTTYESREIYALWLNYISKAPWWGKLVNVERIDIADRLITWVVKQSAPPREGWLSRPNEELHPQDILQEVGYKTVREISHGT